MAADARGAGPVALRPMAAADWPRVAAIYAAGIATGDATFETAVPDWPAWDAAHHAGARLVATRGGEVVGWAACSPVSRRPVYAGVAEVSVYVEPSSARTGVGRALLEALIAQSEAVGIWTLQAGIFPENVASLRLHEACGFRVVGTRARIGRDRARGWRDTVLVERRSEVVGR